MHLNRIAALAFIASAAATCFAQPAIDSPVVVVGAEGKFQIVELDHQVIGQLATQPGEMLLKDFPMPGGKVVDLRIEPFEVLTPEASVVLGTAEGDIEIGRPAVSLYRGSVAGKPDSRVFLSFSPYGTHGLIQSGGSTAVLSSGEFGAEQPLVVTDLADFPEPPDFALGWECHVGPEHINPLGLDLKAIGVGGDGDGGLRVNPCRIASIAIDTDFEYTSWKFDGDIDASAAYAVTLMGAVGEIFTLDLNVRLVVPFVRVWADNVDPYDGGDLSLFRNEWNANMGHIERDLAHMLSGDYGGGVAWVSVLCHNSYGYGLSGVSGGFPYPLEDHNGGNWDVFVVPHELGHNFGTLHTHDGYDPTIDDCGNGDCSDAWGGTIMSYCHICSGGMTNIVLAFHPRVITQVSSYLDGACNILGDNLAFAMDDEADAIQDIPLRIDVLANDIPANCVEPTIFAVVPTTDAGGTAEISVGTGEGGRDEVLYTPPTGYLGEDYVDYMIETNPGIFDTAGINLAVFPGRFPDEPGATRPGARVKYYELDPSVTQLPDFDALMPYGFDMLPEIDFPETTGNFATSGRTSYLGAVFETGLVVPEAGMYTLYLDSDEGSRLVIDGETIVDNDGVHRMIDKSGLIGLHAGLHLLRIEYFERHSKQGLIASIEGPGMTKQVVPAGMWRTADCIADWFSDGVVNTIDFLAFLTAWTEQDPATDLDANGIVNTSDFVLYLGAWAAGCS